MKNIHLVMRLVLVLIFFVSINSLFAQSQWTQTGNILYPNNISWNIGIGITDPGAYKLFVNGNLRLGNGNQIDLFTSSGMNRGNLQVADAGVAGGAGLIIATSNGEHISFRDGGLVGAENMVILGNGDVGIGTPIPNDQLSINVNPNNYDRAFGLTRGSNDWYVSIGGADGLGFANVNNSLTPLWMLNNGNVGIGTGTPDQKLVVNGSVAFDYGNQHSYNGMRLNGTKTEYYNGITSTGTNPIHEFTGMNGAAKLTILEGGNVGIGTPSPTNALEIGGPETTGRLSLNTTGGFVELVTRGWSGSPGILFSAYASDSYVNGGLTQTGNTKHKYSATAFGGAGTHRAKGIVVGHADIGFYISSSPSVQDQDVVWDNRLDITPTTVIVPTGNVGIGTTDPTGTLSIGVPTNGTNNKAIRLHESNDTPPNLLSYAGTWSPTLQIVGNDATTQMIQVIRADGKAFFNTTNNFEFNGGGTYSAIFTGGNVGIGTTSPNQGILHVASGEEKAIYAISNGTAIYAMSSEGNGPAIFGDGGSGSHGVYGRAYDEGAGIYGDGSGGAFAGIFVGGNVLIGKSTQTNFSYKLDVDGSVRANEVVVNTNGSDFVFEDDYRLRGLEEVEKFVKENKRLPEIPSAKEMQEKGVGISELQTKLLQKIEELTLYVIELKKENKELKKEVEEIKNK